MKIKNGQLIVYDVDEEYRDFLRKFDYKVSMKENRRFYGILVTENNTDYCIPFSCQIKKRNTKLTINIKHKNITIAQLLINNMIPVASSSIKIVDINNDKQKGYLKDEVVYLKDEEVIKEILKKSENVIKVMKDNKHCDYEFFKKICCNFQLLEEKCNEWERIHSQIILQQEDEVESEDEEEPEM